MICAMRSTTACGRHHDRCGTTAHFAAAGAGDGGICHYCHRNAACRVADAHGRRSLHHARGGRAKRDGLCHRLVYRRHPADVVTAGVATPPPAVADARRVHAGKYRHRVCHRLLAAARCARYRWHRSRYSVGAAGGVRRLDGPRP